jgi:hypothetical protein
MSKAPEEGKIWEWRAFGQISESLAARVFAYPVRMGLNDLRCEDIYFISETSDQNVKLREYTSGCFLKFKLLLEIKPGAIELYRESARFTHLLPVGFEHLKEAARLLKVRLPDGIEEGATFDEGALVRVFSKSSPPAISGGWLEKADVAFARNRVQSISIHSPDIEMVKGMLKLLNVGDEMEAMNYIEACRRWG